jgi:hypothetical protein
VGPQHRLPGHLLPDLLPDLDLRQLLWLQGLFHLFLRRFYRVLEAFTN